MPDWDGVTERRSDKIPILIQRWNDFIETTKEYRTTQERKQEDIKKTLEKNTKELLQETISIKEALLKMPCEVHAERMKNISWQVSMLWGIAGVISVALLGAWLSIIK